VTIERTSVRKGDIMKRLATLLAFILILSSGPGLFAAGAPKMPKAQPLLTPKQKAVSAFNEGIAHRDKAWKYEEKLAKESNAKKSAKLEAKIRREYEKTIKYCTSATELDPNLFQAYGSLGYALRKTGDHARALVAYDRALELAPGYAEAIEYRGEAYLGLDRINDAKLAYLVLVNGGSDRAGELLTAMRKYVDEKSAAGTDVAEFADWVAKREGVARMSGATASAGDSW
jgi:tetratricopeptide (TPR) repeat protein